MTVSGINTHQALLLQQLTNASLQNSSSSNDTFQNVLIQQMEQLNDSSLQSSEMNIGTNLLGNASGMTGLLLATLLNANSSSGSNAMMMSLCGALMGSSPSSTMFEMMPLTNAMQNMTGTIDATSDDRIPSAASKAVNPAITSDIYNRNPALYQQVIDQFQVETNPRYAVNKKGHGDTYCNIFMWDVTRAMGAEIPHYVDAETKAPRYYPDVKGAREMNANAIYDWLHEHGGKYGWFEVDAAQAQAMANQGSPVVTALRNNSGGHGHVQVVCPSADGVYDPERGVTIAQAGRNLTSYRPITKIYNKSLPKVKYFAHM